MVRSKRAGVAPFALTARAGLSIGVQFLAGCAFAMTVRVEIIRLVLRHTIFGWEPRWTTPMT